MKPLKERKKMIDKANEKISITRQCGLLELNRSTFYYRPNGETELSLELMRLMDEHYLEHPKKGAGQMYQWLRKKKAYPISKNRIERLYYRVMGLRSLKPGPHTSKRCTAHKVYPYLLRDLRISRPNQVWLTDITFIPIRESSVPLRCLRNQFYQGI